MTTATTKVQASWKYPDDPIVSGLALYYRRAGTLAWKLHGKFTGTDITLPDLDVDTKYEFAAAFIDTDGKININDLALHSQSFEGTTAIPPTPANFVGGQTDSYVVLKWDSVRQKVRDFSHYELRTGVSWATGTLIGKVYEAETLTWAWGVAGSTVFHLKAIDKYGKRSSSVSATVVVKDLQNFVADTEQDEDGGGFSGTKTDCEVDGANLVNTRWGVPADTATETANTATWLPWGPAFAEYTTNQLDMGSARNVRIAMDLTATRTDDMAARNAIEFNVPAQLPPALDDGSHLDRTDESSYLEVGNMIAGADEEPVRLDLFIKMDAGSFVPYIPGFYFGQLVTFKVRMWMAWRWGRIVISKMRFRPWKRNLKDEGTFAVGGVGPHDVNFAAPFIDAPYVTAMHSVDTNWVKVSNITAVDFDAVVYDDDGEEVTTGSIFWTALGT